MLRFKELLILILLLSSVPLYAFTGMSVVDTSDNKEKNTVLIPPTIDLHEKTKASKKNGFANYSISVALDYGKVLLIPFKDQTLTEGAIYIKLSTIRLSGEIGGGTVNPTHNIENLTYYKTKGMYFKGGFDFLFHQAEKFSSFLGIRYGKSFFEDKGEYVIASTAWKDYHESFSRQNLNAEWAEVVFSGEEQFEILPHTAFGFKAVARILTNENFNPSTFNNIKVMNIPGYGTPLNVTFGINLYVRYEIPIKSKNNKQEAELK